jgi:hypothetical protein
MLYNLCCVDRRLPCVGARADADVADILTAITPALESQCKWECIVLKNYALFKQSFPEAFKQ